MDQDKSDVTRAPDPLEMKLQQRLREIQREETPEGLLDLARELQELLRRNQQPSE